MKHVRQHRLDGMKYSLHIHREDTVPQFIPDILDLTLLGDSGVVDKYIHRSELFPYSCHHGIHFTFYGDIRLICHCAVPFRVQLSG